MIADPIPLSAGAGIAGFISGFFVKKLVKIIAFCLGGLTVLLLYLQHINIISLNSQKLQSGLVNATNSGLHQLNGVMAPMSGNSDILMPVCAFGVCFVMGLRYG